MKLIHYQNQAFPFALPDDDTITFFVLARILNGPCAHIHTDGENVMICLSDRIYPVWVWCRDEDDTEAIAAIAECLKTHFPLNEGYRYNMSYGMFERLRRADDAFGGRGGGPQDMAQGVLASGSEADIRAKLQELL